MFLHVQSFKDIAIQTYTTRIIDLRIFRLIGVLKLKEFLNPLQVYTRKLLYWVNSTLVHIFASSIVSKMYDKSKQSSCRRNITIIIIFTCLSFMYASWYLFLHFKTVLSSDVLLLRSISPMPDMGILLIIPTNVFPYP